MGKDSTIEWTDHTFNPWWGCEKVSPACAHCYAETWAQRCGADVWGKTAPRRFFGEKHWNEPLKWNRAAEEEVEEVLYDFGEDSYVPPARPRVFCASMADVFEGREDLQAERERLWKLIEVTRNLDWLLLTKRPENVAGMVPHEWMVNGFPANVWMGTTVEDQVRAEERVPLLLSIPARVRFLSCEPLLGPVDVGEYLNCYCPLETGCDCPTIHWVICGGESGPGARPMNPDWARGLRDQCEGAGVPFLFKQWGEWVRDAETSHAVQRGRESAVPTQIVPFGDGNPTNFRRMYRVGKKAAGRLLDGRVWDGVPGGS